MDTLQATWRGVQVIALMIIRHVQKKSDTICFPIYFSQLLDKFYETFREYP